ncbi:hypothetical protein M0R45_018751 [Rubus argutus]|uniref:Small EDRK-rich factor-like N-terminal domain-containing protein n=1 Tax=Rubus argutus TaxID=59490 RepID=A0AAW1X3U7_RUBAR
MTSFNKGETNPRLLQTERQQKKINGGYGGDSSKSRQRHEARLHGKAAAELERCHEPIGFDWCFMNLENHGDGGSCGWWLSGTEEAMGDLW